MLAHASTGTSIDLHQRHDTYSVNAPPINGPPTIPNCAIDIMKPSITALGISIYLVL